MLPPVETSHYIYKLSVCYSWKLSTAHSINNIFPPLYKLYKLPLSMICSAKPNYDSTASPSIYK